MSGILDNKSRIMDTIVTLEGRRQMAEGKLRIEYVSFTDNSTFYEPDAVSGSADPSNRLYFEQCQLPQDQITFEADDSGFLKPFRNVNNTDILSGKIVSSSNFNNQVTFLTGTQFASTAQELLLSSINNFKNLQILATQDYVFEDIGFDASPSELNFELNLESPVPSNQSNRNLTDLPSLFNDKHFSKVKNFKYLPPINKIDDASVVKSDPTVIDVNKIGEYENLNTQGEYTSTDLEDDLRIFENDGFKKSIRFEPTSLSNNLIAQIFEVNGSDIKKLDVLDFGEYRQLDSFKHAYFVGKVLVDDNGSQTFVKMFTLVFD